MIVKRNEMRYRKKYDTENSDETVSRISQTVYVTITTCVLSVYTH
jgi:hypothetical protein